MRRIALTLLPLCAALVACSAAGPSGDVAIRTDGRGLFVAAGREDASATGVLVAHHEAAEEARAFCEGRQRRVQLIGPFVDADPGSDKVVVLVRFRCAGGDASAQARP